MRISDWSSDVCSSDLDEQIVVEPEGQAAEHHDEDAADERHQRHPALQAVGDADRDHSRRHEGAGPNYDAVQPIDRSDEHTSALQSLMPISYAVFSLKTKTNSTANTPISPSNTHTNITIRHTHTLQSTVRT